MNLDFSRYVFAPPYLGWLCQGFLMTLVIGVLGAVCGTILGLLVLRLRGAANCAARAMGTSYIMLFRNLPMVPLLLFLTFALPGIWRQLTGANLPRESEFHFLILGLSLNAGAYIAEILRAGVEAIPHEQLEAARTLGLSPKVIRRRIVFPQAARIVAPALASRYIHIMKNSSLALVVPLQPDLMEMVGQVGRIAGQTFAWAEPLLFAAVGYLSLSLFLSWILNRWANHEQLKIEENLRSGSRA